VCQVTVDEPNSPNDRVSSIALTPPWEKRESASWLADSQLILQLRNNIPIPTPSISTVIGRVRRIKKETLMKELRNLWFEIKGAWTC